MKKLEKLFFPRKFRKKNQSIIRSMIDRAQSVIPDEDEIKEEHHIKEALKMCQYPDWTFNKTKEKMEEAKANGQDK